MFMIPNKDTTSAFRVSAPEKSPCGERYFHTEIIEILALPGRERIEND
jgi:hypothetical protein